MKAKESPYETGISGITGKMVKIRHAMESDMVFIKRKLREYNLDAEHLDYRQFVIATENGDIIGLGRLKKTGEAYEIGCVAVVEEQRQRGIGAEIVRHLIELAPVKLIYALTDLSDYFKKLGFVELKEGAKELMDALDKACRIEGKKDTVLMVYEK